MFIKRLQTFETHASFAQRTITALSKVSHFTDGLDSFASGILDPANQADLMDRPRFSTHKLIENWIQPLTAQELPASVSAFWTCAPMVSRVCCALHQKSQRFAILVFTRAMDSSEEREEKKFAGKRSRYAPVLDFFNSVQKTQGWTMIQTCFQFNFTVGVRGSISQVDCTTPLSFFSAPKALDITSRVNLEIIRKLVAKRNFEAHDLMLRSYYAVRFSSSSQVDDVSLIAPIQTNFRGGVPGPTRAPAPSVGTVHAAPWTPPGGPPPTPWPPRRIGPPRRGAKVTNRRAVLDLARIPTHPNAFSGGCHGVVQGHLS